jgi:hypothetical protein
MSGGGGGYAPIHAGDGLGEQVRWLIQRLRTLRRR